MRESGNSMRDGTIFRGGNIVALVTPFNRENNVDFNRLKGLIEFHILKQIRNFIIRYYGRITNFIRKRNE